MTENSITRRATAEWRVSSNDKPTADWRPQLPHEKPTASWRPPPYDKSASVMRRFLESGVDFTWPPDCGGDIKDNHCNLHGRKAIPLSFIKNISDKKASIDVYRGDSRYEYQFKEAFVVKTIRDSTKYKSRTRAKNEVDTMRDLRHPHVAALLGTFMFQERLSILIFPAACCDLHQYMKSLSKELAEFRQEKTHFADVQSEGTRTPDSTTSSARNRHISNNAAAAFSGESVTNLSELHVYSWPLKLSYPKKLESLRGFFVCLAQALSYIHGSDVRHKDVKPENILIDSSGSVIITDFGISRSFPKQAPHVTNDRWEMTRKYASPEIMRGQKVPRDDPSDVFSLGCVFLEMATLVLGKSLNKFSEHYTTLRNDAVEYAYYCNLDRVHTWIDHLQGPRRWERQAEPQAGENLNHAHIEIHDFVTEVSHTADLAKGMLDSLNTIRQMLDETPAARPKAEDLWKNFKEVSSDICRDCDPRHPTVWKPSASQQQRAEEGTSRRSLHQIPEEAASGRSANEGSRFIFTGIDSSLLSAQDGYYNQKQRRSSSPHIHPRTGGDSLNSTNGNSIAGQSIPGASVKRASSPDTRVRHMSNRSTRTASPRPASPTSSAKFALAKKTYQSRAASPPSGRNQPNILHKIPSASQASGMEKRNSVSFAPSSPRASRTTLKSNSGDLPEKQAQKAARPVEDKLPPATDCMIHDFEGEVTYVAPYISLRGRDYRSYTAPRSDQQVEIGEKPKILRKVDLSSLGIFIRIRRFKGDFPRIYVINIPMG